MDNERIDINLVDSPGIFIQDLDEDIGIDIIFDRNIEVDISILGIVMISEGGGGGGVTDHGLLTGLDGDDHGHYLTNARGDARYELRLGNPSVSGYVLSSTLAGVRSWIPTPVADVSDWFEIVNEGLPNEYLRCKKSFAGDYEIQAWSNTGWLPPTIWESMPLATSSSIGGIQLGTGSTLFLREDGTWQPAGGSGGMVYPLAGIAVSTGTSWAAPIVAVNNQVAVFDNANTIEGHTGFTYDSATGILDVATIARAAGSLQHLTLQAGNASGAVGTDAGNVIIKSGNAIIDDALSLPGSIYLDTGANAWGGINGVFLGSPTAEGDKRYLMAEGVEEYIDVHIKPKLGTIFLDTEYVRGNGFDLWSYSGDGMLSFQASTSYQISEFIIEAAHSGPTFQAGDLILRGGVSSSNEYPNAGDLYIQRGWSNVLGTSGKIYIGQGVGASSCDLDIDDTETYLVAIDPTIGLLSRRSVASMKDSLVTANFSIVQESGKLVIKYGSTVIASITSAGLITAANDVVAFGTP